ncbi:MULTISPECIES: Calx-beta domain-containing protein [Gammaproteobacteria]|uniref:Calx-beta domain-containing protein n=1 Tax=Gammaproteobacteria TaxID=1236 RepID=UPI001402E60E|nr:MULTISPECIES: Calx-beta domain-containing protein [Gammaproteobacteria]
MSFTALALAASLTTDPFVEAYNHAKEHNHDVSCLTVHADELGLEPRMFSSFDAEQATIDENGLYVLDLAVWYRPGWADAIGEQEIDKRVAQWIETTNRVFRNSDVNVRVNVLFAREMAYAFEDYPDATTFANSTLNNSAGRGWMHVSPFGSGTEDYLPDDYPMFHLTSAEYGADLHLWIQEGQDEDVIEGPMGLASTHGITAAVVDQSTAPFNAERNLVAEAVLSTGQTVAHEIGHNLGLMHEWSTYEEVPNGFESDGFASRCGQGRVPGTATTIMWSVGHPDYLKREIVSSPEIFMDDEACGSYERENQTRVANARAEIASAHAVRPEALGNVRFTQSVYESPYGRDNLVVTLERDGDLSQTAEVEVTAIDGGAEAGTHYNGLKQVVTFQAGSATSLAQFELLSTPDDGQTRTFDIKMQYPLRLDIEFEYALAVLEGANDAPAQGDFSITSSITLAERGEGELVVSRVGGSSGEAVLNVSTVDGTAEAYTHYQPINMQVRFLDGETEKTIPVQVFTTDTTREFNVVLSSVTEAEVLQETAQVRMLSGQSGEVYFTYTEREGEYLNRCDRISEIARPYRCSVRTTVDKPLSTEIRLPMSRLFGDVGPKQVVVHASTFEVSPQTNSYPVQLDEVVEPIQTVFFADGQSEGEVVFVLSNLPTPEELVEEYGFQTTNLNYNFRAVIVDESRDLDFLRNPVEINIQITPVFEDDGSDGDDGNDGGDDGSDGDNDGGDGDNDGGDSGDGGQQPAQPKSSGGSVNPLFLMLLVGLFIRQRYKS